MPTNHIPVLLHEVLEALGYINGKIVADGTLGGGGHTRAFLKAGASVVATDWDAAALERCTGLGAEFKGRFEAHQLPYDNLPEALASREAFGILLDLGFSSDQLDDPARGLSYHHDGPLDMRLNSSLKSTAADILNGWREEQLADLFYIYAEEHRSRPLARAIVGARKLKPFETTLDFLKIIETLYPKRHGQHKAHPAARLFQALRVVVNDELAVLERALNAAAGCLAMGGNLAVITFQPAEERLVKQVFRKLCEDELDEVGRVKTVAPFKQGKKITPSEAEVGLNPRARSAILRTLRRVG